MNGILLLNKRSGISSAKAINEVKYALKDRGIDVHKIGHCGTLDPLASGLMVVLINDATKISDYVLLEDKSYLATIVIGKEYDTLDLEGNLIREDKITKEDFNNIKQNIDQVLNSLIGPLMQIPPIYSSLKYQGKKLYEYARNNNPKIDELVNKKKREVIIHSIEKIKDIELHNDECLLTIKLRVSKGTYIRSLSKTIGDKLGYPASIHSLERLSSGKFEIEKSYTIEDIRVGNFQLLNPLVAFDDYKIIEVNNEMKKQILNGMMINLDCTDDVIVLKNNDQILAIYEYANNGKYRAKRVWN